MNRPSLRAAAFAAAALATPAFGADWYGGVDVGRAAMDEPGAFGVPLAGFGGPTVDHDICGDTAVITLGASPSVDRIDAASTAYRLFLGARSGDWSYEFGMFNIARLGGRADGGPYAVAQPACNPVPTDPITVDAFGRRLETISFRGWSFTPVWSWGFAEGWTLDLRGTVAFWDREERSQWLVMVTELENAVPLQTYPTAGVSDQRSGSGVDLWPGVGASWTIKDGVRLRGIVEQQSFRELSTLSWTLGVAIDL